jgi:HSP20 family protein
MAKLTAHLLLRPTPVFDADFGAGWGAPRWQPRIDIARTPEAILIHIEAAGLDDDTLRLHYEPGRLIIEGYRQRLALPQTAQCIQVEIAYGSFRREVLLPPEADGENIQAVYQAGLLLITVPVKPPTEPSTVRVNVG